MPIRRLSVSMSKRKAAGGASSIPKRVRSGLATPRSIDEDSDDEYTEDTSGALSDTEKEDYRELVQRYSVSTYAKKKKQQPTTGDAASLLFAGRDFLDLPLKADHKDRPLWIDPERGRIIMESFSPMFKTAETFLINVAEPQSRVSRIHEYTLTTHSLFAAVSVGLTTDDILRWLDALSKTPVPESIKNFIVKSTSSFGKVRLVLKHTKYFIESSDPSVLQTLLKDEVISQKRVNSGADISTEAAPKMGNMVIPGTKMAAGAKQVGQNQLQPPPGPVDQPQTDQQKEIDQLTRALLEDDDEEEAVDQVHSFEVAPESIQEVSRRCRALNLPLTEEYDFRNDEINAMLDIDLKPMAQIRTYQEQALNKMFGNGRARSGIIVLPCGAGKTLVGITAACTVKKGVIVLCTSAMSVVQWRNEFLKWSNVSASDIASFTADQKDVFPGNTGIIISTYSMITQSKGRSYESEKVMKFIEDREWGLMILDEVHVVPADMFKKVTYKVKAHSKLGLTATLLREDDKIQDLNFLIGPKLYEANWQELSEQGHIARVQCAEVWCPMTAEFYTEYLKADTVNKRVLLFTMNPRKFQACQFLIDYHERRGDKVIVFSDNVYALESYAKKLCKAYIFGGTPQQERMRILENFQYNDSVNTIFLSKIGDTSLDLPEATCLIQISSHYGSRRQEAQRLGRILRAKRRNDEGFNAFFYSLVSKDTQEMYYSSKRQAFLVDQGYAFKVITNLNGMHDFPMLAFNSASDRVELLQDVLIKYEEDKTLGGEERIEGDLYSSGKLRPTGNKKVKARRQAGVLSEFSGGGNMAYVEFNKSRNKELKGRGNKFVNQLWRQEKRKKILQ